MPYSNNCKNCNHVWETDKVDPVCPNCGATGGGVIGFAYIEDAVPPEAVSSVDTETEPPRGEQLNNIIVDEESYTGEFESKSASLETESKIGFSDSAEPNLTKKEE
jgi:rubredoxin